MIFGAIEMGDVHAGLMSQAFAGDPTRFPKLSNG